MKTVQVDGAPKAIGPYAQAVEAGGFLFTAGQVAFDPATMKIVEGGIAEQTARVFDNLAAVLAGAGLGFADVVKATVFLADLDDFAEMNKVYAARMGDHRPARSTVQVARLPAGSRIEVDFIAKLPG